MSGAARAVDADALLRALRDAGLDLFTGTPCSLLGPLLDAVAAAAPGVTWIPAPNEGDAVALAAGARIGGRGSVALFQNSGLGNAVNALTSLCDPFGVPVLLVVSHRGRPGEPDDEPQHRLMGRITVPLLDAMGVGHRVVGEGGPVERLVAEAAAWMEERRRPFALVVPRGALGRGEAGVAPGATTGRAGDAARPPGARPAEFPMRPAADPTLGPPAGARPGGAPPPPSRLDVLRAVLAAERSGDVLVGTTGHTGRQLHDLADGPARLYVVGSMGSASAVGLGLAVARPERRIVVLDGDGALQMRMGNLALVGASAPTSFLHVVLDNGVHASTGGQPVAGRVRWADAALACGYAGAAETADPAEVEDVVRRGPDGPFLLHVRISGGEPTGGPPGRPGLTPREVAERLARHLAG